MGIKASILIYSDGCPRERLAEPLQLDRDATIAFAQRVIPGTPVQQAADTTFDNPFPDPSDFHIGWFGRLAIVVASAIAEDCPSQIAPYLLNASEFDTLTYVGTHSIPEWCAYARWFRGKIVRSVSLSSERGEVAENIGEQFEFERPFWSGERGSEWDDPSDPIPFCPMDIAEAALESLLGYSLEAQEVMGKRPEDIPLMHFVRARNFAAPGW